MSDAGAGPRSIRNRFVSSTATLPGWWGEWCLSLGTAVESCFLLGRAAPVLPWRAARRQTSQREGSGLGGCLMSLLAQRFCGPCIQILAWLLPLSVLLRPSVPTPPDVLNPNFRRYCVALGFSAPGSSLVDHKLVTLCSDAS